jgi:putative type II restriction endonuclease
MLEWNLYRNKFENGVNFKIEKQNDGKIIVKNDLPKKSKTKIFHLRPHASKSKYVIGGQEYGNGNNGDTDELPNGDKMTKQCFWLNNDYIIKIIKDIIIKGEEK